MALRLAKGGMGVVYRARDTRLNRDVAIKILPAAFASDSDRAARFTREAQVLAALNHPHIAQIYGVEEAPASRGPSSSERASAKVDFAPVRALVMELVEGESLAARLTRGALVVDDALAIARQLIDVMTSRVNGAAPNRVALVFNFFDELRRAATPK